MMSTVEKFFDMGGHAIFIWPSYALTAVVLIGLLALSLRFLHASEATLAALQAGEGARGETADGSGEA